MEKKLKLLQDIASEFSVNWNSFAFQQRMINNTAAREVGRLSVLLLMMVMNNFYFLLNDMSTTTPLQHYSLCLIWCETI